MMINYITKIKRQFRDAYSFVPSGGTDTDPTFDSIPDGEYPMVIDGKVDYVRITEGRINCCNFKEKQDDND